MLHIPGDGTGIQCFVGGKWRACNKRRICFLVPHVLAAGAAMARANGDMVLRLVRRRKETAEDEEGRELLIGGGGNGRRTITTIPRVAVDEANDQILC